MPVKERKNCGSPCNHSWPIEAGFECHKGDTVLIVLKDELDNGVYDDCVNWEAMGE